MLRVCYYFLLFSLSFNVFSAAFSKDELAANYLLELEKDSYWRLFVDGFRQRNSFAPDESKYGDFFWTAREPNGLVALRATAQRLSTEYLDSPLTIDLIVEINRQSFPVNDHLYLTSAHLTRGEERTFGEIHEKAHLGQVLGRALHFMKLGNMKDWPYKVANNQIEHSGWTFEDKVIVVNNLIDQYHLDLAEAEGNQKKLEIIAQLMQDIELLHIFTDGNCRSVYLLLNKELIRNELEPVILFNPNNFDFFTVEELVAQITRGQAAFRRLVTDGLPYEDCFSAEVIALNIATMPEEIRQSIPKELGMTLEEAANIIASMRTFFGLLSKENCILTRWRTAMRLTMGYSALSRTKKDIDHRKYLRRKDLIQTGHQLANQICDSTDKSDNQFCMFFERLNFALVEDYSLVHHQERILESIAPAQIADEFLQRLQDLCQ